MTPPSLAAKLSLRCVIVALLVSWGTTTKVLAQATIPDLAKLKLAAESGDARAEFEYGRSVSATNPQESFAMILKSARQGYGPAEERIGALYLERAPINKERGKIERLGVRFTSRAAFKGFTDAQARLSHCYENGVALPKNPTLAYAWMAIAARAGGGFSVYKGSLDVLVARTPSPIIAEGQRLANNFKPTVPYGLNPIETDMLIAQMKLTAIYLGGGRKAAVINQTRFYEGDTLPVPIDGEPIELTCTAVSEKMARFTLGTHQFTLTTK